MSFFYAIAKAFVLLMDLGPSREYLTKEKHELSHLLCLGYSKVTTFSGMQRALHLMVSKFQLDLYNEDEFIHKFHFWLNASSTGFNYMVPADF